MLAPGRRHLLTHAPDRRVHIIRRHKRADDILFRSELKNDLGLSDSIAIYRFTPLPETKT